LLDLVTAGLQSRYCFLIAAVLIRWAKIWTPLDPRGPNIGGRSGPPQPPCGMRLWILLTTLKHADMTLTYWSLKILLFLWKKNLPILFIGLATIYTVFQKIGTLFLLTITKSNVDRLWTLGKSVAEWSGGPQIFILLTLLRLISHYWSPKTIF